MHLCVRVLQSVLVHETGPLGLRDQPGLRLYLFVAIFCGG